MKIIALTMTRNEQDIIEPFLRHHSALVDHMYLLDASVDGTYKIIEQCGEELGNISVRKDEAPFGWRQSSQMNEALKEAQTIADADVVLLLDVDEFVGTTSREELERELERIPVGGVGYWVWKTYVLGLENPDPPRTMTVRRDVERPAYKKVVLRGIKQANIAGGNHYLHGEYLSVDLSIPLMHFPVRSRAQLQAKCVTGWLSVLKTEPVARQCGVAYQHREAFDEIVAGMPKDRERVIALTYAQHLDGAVIELVEDPFPFTYERKYSDGSFADPVTVIVKTWEQSIVR